jgi:hypothetical protein
MRKRAERATSEEAYPLEYGMFRVRRLDLFGRFSDGLARLALQRGRLHFRLLSDRLDRLRGLLYFGRNLSLRRR